MARLCSASFAPLAALAFSLLLAPGCSDAAGGSASPDSPALDAGGASAPGPTAPIGGGSEVDASGTDGAAPAGHDAGSPVGAADAGGPAACVDTCAAKVGVTWSCEKRFLFGINYAWHSFGADFGGIAAWQQPGVSGVAATHAQNLASMKAHGANVIRWWIFPDFRGDGVQFDAKDSPTGLGGTTIADLQKGLELADQADLFVMLTVFSFDAFRPTTNVNGLDVRDIAPMIRDAGKHAALLTNVVRPLARAVEASPHRHRMIAWDVINEPEWAMTGPSPYGDPDYTPTSGLDALTHGEMEGFVKDVAGALRAESHALVTVGSAAVKWAHAWSHVGVDFYQFHYYDWINKYWPYTNAPGTYGLDKPLVIGEFPVGDLASGIHYPDVVNAFYKNGYAGALSWAFDGAAAADLDNETAFASAHPCDTHFDKSVAASLVSHAPRPPIPVNASRASAGAVPSVRACRRAVDGPPICD